MPKIEPYKLDLYSPKSSPYTRDVSLLNSFETMLPNEIVFKFVLFWKKKKKKSLEKYRGTQTNMMNDGSQIIWIDGISQKLNNKMNK